MNTETITISSYSLGTIINLRAQGNSAKQAIQDSIGRLNDIDDKMSAFKKDSEISKINFKAGTFPEIISKDTYLVIKAALKYSKILNGAYDPTIRPLVALWNIGTTEKKIPEKCKIHNKLKLVNYKDVILDDSKFSVLLKKKNQSLDLGGIAKGFAADEIRDIFYRYKISSALIDLGGNIFALGSKLDGTSWRVGIQDPFKERGEFMGILSVKNKSVVTSGNYERYFTQDGKRFHHIIDTKTGYPSSSKIISATIISDNSIDGDGLSTGIYIIGIEKAIPLIESIVGVDAILITEDKKTYVTSGVYESFEVTNKKFLRL